MSKEKILVVEDEKISAMDIQNTLESVGYEVVDVVDSGEGAIESAAKTFPDLVLMDIVLKGDIDGIEAADMIRNQLDIPVIYLTAHADDVTLRLAKATVPYGYLIKPFDERELFSMLEMAIQKRKTECELKASEEKYRSLVEGANDGITIIQDSIIMFVNPSFIELCGYKIEDLMGKAFTEFVSQDELQRIFEFDRKRIRGEDPNPIFQTAMRHKNGLNIPVELNIVEIPYRGGFADLVNIREISHRNNP